MSKIKIVTHNSSFHSDDVFAVATLSLVLDKKGDDFEIIRTRDLEIINNGDFVVDVGGVYNSEKNLFDHHQIGGGGKRENGIPYASFGLVWKKYGEGLCGDNKELAQIIDQKLVQPIDAIDCGVEIVETLFEDVLPYHFHDFIDALNPSWKEKDIDLDQKFIEAVSFSRLLLNREIKKEGDRFLAKDIVLKKYEEAKDKRLIILDGQYPAKDILRKFPEPLFVVSPRDDGTWVIITVQDKQFINRKSLPFSWSGKFNQDLEKVTGVVGSVFCHTDCFIAVAKTKEAILELAEIALNN